MKGLSALITGAGRGIGRALALRLAAEGVRVTLVARTAIELDELVAAIRRGGGAARAVVADVTDPAAVRTAAAAAAADFGPVAILVNNAGIPGPYGPVDEIDPALWWAAQAVNVYGPLLFMRAVAPAMRAARAGRIINITSNAGLQPIPHLSAYAVSKTTLTRLTETVDLELRESGVRAFALNPGTIITDMARGTIASPEAQQWVADGVAMLRNRTVAQSDGDLARCCDVVAALAAGRHDRLGGRYLDIHDDLDVLAAVS